MNKHTYKIEMGDYLEDYSIFYSEFENGKLVRELKAEVHIVKNAFYYIPILKTRIVLHLDTFKNWNTFKELTLYEYTVVLKRIYDFLEKIGYRIILSN